MSTSFHQTRWLIMVRYLTVQWLATVCRLFGSRNGNSSRPALLNLPHAFSIEVWRNSSESVKFNQLRKSAQFLGNADVIGHHFTMLCFLVYPIINTLQNLFLQKKMLGIILKYLIISIAFPITQLHWFLLYKKSPVLLPTRNKDLDRVAPIVFQGTWL